MIARSPFAGGALARRAPSLAVAALCAALLGCEDGATGPPVDGDGERVLVVGLARQDLSPDMPLEGFLALFFHLDADSLLTADARVIRTSILPVDTVELTDTVTPLIVDGVFYVQGADILSGLSYRLEATIATGAEPLEVLSDPVPVPAVFDLEIPRFHPVGETLVVRWEGTPDASKVNVAAGSGFQIDVPATETRAEIPAEAFAGLAPGDSLEIEVTAYNDFYVPLAAGIGSLADAEEFAESLDPVDHIEGARGAFGSATTVGTFVILE